MSRKKGSRNKKTKTTLGFKDAKLNIETIAISPVLEKIIDDLTLKVEEPKTVISSEGSNFVHVDWSKAKDVNGNPMSQPAPVVATYDCTQDPLYKAFVNDGIILDKPPILDGGPEAPKLSETVIGGSVESEMEKPVFFHRDETSGLVDGYSYKYKANGKIDWQAMLNPEFFIYPKDDMTKEPMCKVDGLLEIADIRGIESKVVKIVPVSETMIAVTVTMYFSPNREEPRGKTWTGSADATISNVGDKKFAKFLTTMAETRATGRCIKGALGIRMYAFEEMIKEEVMEQEDTSGIKDTTIIGIKRQMEVKYGKDELALLKDVGEKEPDIAKLTNLHSLNAAQGAKVLAFLNKKQNKES